MQAQRFGRKSERLSEIVGQTTVFNEAEAEAEKTTEEPETAEPETETITYTRNKKKPGTLDEMLKGIPTREEWHELSEEELTEIFGKDGWKRLPDEVYRKLEYTNKPDIRTLTRNTSLQSMTLKRAISFLSDDPVIQRWGFSPDPEV